MAAGVPGRIGSTSQTISITTMRERITRLPEELAEEGLTSIAVTRRGEPVLAVIPWALYESIIETLDVMGDPELMATLRASIAQISEGKARTSEAVRAELGL